MPLEPDHLKHIATIAGIAADKHLDYTSGRSGGETHEHYEQHVHVYEAVGETRSILAAIERYQSGRAMLPSPED